MNENNLGKFGIENLENKLLTTYGMEVFMEMVSKDKFKQKEDKHYYKKNKKKQVESNEGYKLNKTFKLKITKNKQEKSNRYIPDIIRKKMNENEV